MDVAAGLGVRPLGHDARHHGHAEVVQRVRDAVHADRQYAGIGEHDFIEVGRGRIAVERRLNVANQQAADLGQPSQEHLREFTRTGRAIAHRAARGVALLSIAQAVVHFALDFRRERRHRLRNMCREILRVEVTPAEVAGIHQIEHGFQDLDDGLARRQKTVRDAPRPLVAQIAVEQFLDERLRHARQATACIFSTSSKSPSNRAPDK